MRTAADGAKLINATTSAILTTSQRLELQICTQKKISEAESFKGRGINLSTEDIIEYDSDKLKAMDEKELLCQLIALQHLDRPNRESILAAKEYAGKVAQATEDFQLDLEKLGAEGLSDRVAASLKLFLKATGLDVVPQPPDPEPVVVAEVIV